VTASLHLPYIFEACPHYTIYQYFVPFLLLNNILLHGYITFCLSVPQLLDLGLFLF
jgi:hypothetical protein